MVILICQFGNETNTFAPGRTEIAQLSPKGWIPGEAVEELFGHTRSYLGGAIRAIREADVEALCAVLPRPAAEAVWTRFHPQDAEE